MNGLLRKIAVFHFNAGLLYARMALLCVSFREDNAAVATIGLEVFKRGYMTLLRVTYGPVERLHMALLREAAKIFDPAL